MKCIKCGFEGNPNLEETGPHTKATCKKCGSYIKMMNKEELKEQTNSESKEFKNLIEECENLIEDEECKETKPYILISGETPINLDEGVEMFLKQGYKLYYGPFFGDDHYHQAVIKGGD